MVKNTLEGNIIVAGVVKAVYAAKDATHPTTVVLEESHYDKDKKEDVTEEYRVAFFNSKDNEKVKRAEWAAKIKKDSFIMVLGVLSDPYEGTQQMVGFSFKYGGCYTFLDEEGNEKNLILGSFVPNKEQKNKNYYRGSIPETVRENGEEKTIFHNISFGFSKSTKKAENAEKCLKKRGDKYTKVLALCSENSGNDDFPFSYFGQRFDLVPAKKED